jgi:hypothetical protein
MQSVPIDANRIRQIIAVRHRPTDWLLLDEFPLEGGKRTLGTPRIDVLAVKLSNRVSYAPFSRIGFEIKVSRQDFLAELKNPEKRQRAYKICDEYWFVVPENLISVDEVPTECGLLSVVPGLAITCLEKMAKQLKPDPPTGFFMADLARRAYQVGQRDGAGTCAFERFDMLMNLAEMLIRNVASASERREAVNAMAGAIGKMQRRAEAQALREIAAGHESGAVWFAQRILQSGRDAFHNSGRNQMTVRF